LPPAATCCAAMASLAAAFPSFFAT
jgi:hypothetical protein